MCRIPWHSKSQRLERPFLIVLGSCWLCGTPRELWDKGAQMGMTSQECWRWLQAVPAGTSRPEPGALWEQL